MNMKEHFMKQRKGAHASERHVRFVESLKRNQQTPKVETSGAAVYGSFIYILEFHTPAGWHTVRGSQVSRSIEFHMNISY